MLRIGTHYISALLFGGALATSLYIIGTDHELSGPFFSMLAAALAICFWRSRPVRLYSQPTLFHWLILAFTLYAGVSVTWSSVPYISQSFITLLALPGLLSWLFLYIPRKGDSPLDDGLALTVHLFLIIIAFYGISAMAEYIFWPPTESRVNGPFMNPNNFAAFLNLGALFSLGLFFARPQLREPLALFYGFLFLCSFGGILVSESRGGMISFVMGLIILVPFAALPMRQQKSKLAAAAAGLVILPNLLYGQGYVSTGRNVAESLGSSISVSVIDRFSLWESSWEMFLDHIWGGIGLGTFTFHYGGYRLPQDQSDGFFAHMDPLQFGLEMGWIAPVLFYLMLLSIFVVTLKALFLKPDVATRMRILAPFAALVAVTAHTHISFHYYLPSILFVTSFWLVYWHRAVYTTNAVNEPKTGATMNQVVLAACALLLLWFVTFNVQVSLTAPHLRTLDRTGYQGPEAERALAAAHIFAPNSQYRLSLQEARMNRIKMQTAQSAEQQKAYFDAAMAAINNAIDHNEAFAGLYSERARLLMMAPEEWAAGGKQQAEEDLLFALAQNKMAIGARLLLSNLYQSQGEIVKARRIMEEGLKWPRIAGQSDVDYIVAVARLRQATGDQRGAQQLLNEAMARAKNYGLTFPRNP